MLCPKCHGAGWHFQYFDVVDDYYEVYCSCSEGQEKAMTDWPRLYQEIEWESLSASH